jgi:O-antigen/teichoic acid export membrane protein
VTDDPGASARLSTRINRGVAWTAASQTIVAISDLLSQVIVVAFWLSKEDLGLAMAAVPLYSILDCAADLGVTSALIQRDDHTPERVSTVFWFNMMVTGGLFGLLLLGGPLYGHVLGHAVLGWLLIAYGGKLLLQNFYSIQYALLRKDLQFAEVAKIRTVAYLAESVTRIVFAACGIYVWCFTLAALAKSLVFAVLMQWRHPFWPKWVFRPRDVMPYIRFGLRNAGSQLLYYTYTNLDYPIVTYYFGAAANGIYALAYWVVLEAVKTIANVIIDVAFPTFARMRDDREGLIKSFIKLTRLNLIAVLPFVVLILLIVPEFLRLAYGGGRWSDSQLALCADASRILCIVGLLRALGFIGPPLLDGIGRPGLTLRYMAFASIFVPGAFVLCAELLGARYGLLSVAIGWAVGYPIAFAILSYLVVKAIDLPMMDYVKGSAGILACAGGGLAVGLAAQFATSGSGDVLRMIVVGSTALVGTFGLLAWWQGVTPRSIARSLRG